MSSLPIDGLHIHAVKRRHQNLNTTFVGAEHPLSTKEAPIHQFLGIKYATIPERFRQSKVCTIYPPVTLASQHGPICPQPTSQQTTEEMLFGLAEGEGPSQHLVHDEFECLNLNITCPSGLTAFSRLPVMLWFHGGGEKGAGSHWVYDGGSLVRRSILVGKPVIVVTFNYRIGLLGFAASPILRDDNKLAGDEGTGNYGLRDQQRCLDWLHRNIGEFGGDPSNITLFGASSGAADIICHLLSRANEANPMFARAIAQSAVFEPTVPDVSSAGWQLSRMMSALRCTDVEKLRRVEVEKLVGLGSCMRAVDDGVFFRDGWKSWFNHVEHSDRKSHRSQSKKPTPHIPKESFLRSPALSAKKRLPSRSRSRVRDASAAGIRSPHHDMQLQPLIIGDNVSDSLLWSIPISLWTSAAVVRRIKAICLSLTKANNILRAYDISPYTPEEEISERVLELVNDARVAWPTECIADNAKREKHCVWRYVFDQEGPSRGIPHHAADIMYLFDTVPLPASISQPASEDGSEDGSSDGAAPVQEMWYDGPFDDSDEDETFKSPDLAPRYTDLEWETAVVDEFSYARVRNTMQEKWIAFAHGESPWREDKVFVFGPEGETGERSLSIFEGRRRRHVWRGTLEPLGQAIVQKIGVELSRGPCGTP